MIRVEKYTDSGNKKRRQSTYDDDWCMTLCDKDI